MPYIREMICFHSNLIVEMYLKFDVFPCWLHFFRRPLPHYIYIYLKNDPENTEFRGSGELLHV